MPLHFKGLMEFCTLALIQTAKLNAAELSACVWYTAVLLNCSLSLMSLQPTAPAIVGESSRRLCKGPRVDTKIFKKM